MTKQTYDQISLEKKWQNTWKTMQIYTFDPKSIKPVYSIDVPPRYASGPLHAGHAVHYTHIDFAARYRRMQGYNVFFPLCFDVNGIPIEERVERERNITRKDIDRHAFTKLCSAFAEKNIGIMKEQFEILGESMDPSIYYQTDAEYYRRITQISFLDLYKKGYIYKGKFPVNWCPRCMTAMADAEVTYKDNTTMLNTIKFYFTNDQPEHITEYPGIQHDEQGTYIEIATTRPELLPSCQIVAVHPTDERAPWLVDQEVHVPLFQKKVKIVEDEAVDPTFGTGLVMICTIGDKEDLNWVFKYKLPIEMSIDEEGRMTERAEKYQGRTIKEARKEIIEDLKAQKLLLTQIPLDQNVGVCWRCKTPVEFINAHQWFLKTTPFKELVLNASNAMNWYPEYMKIRLEEWVNSLEWDWVISRQRYFATPIPLWECEACQEVVLARPEDCYVDPTIDKPPVDCCPKCGGTLKGNEDVFDTWMDSSISPLYNTFWNRDDTLFQKLYPMSVRPQAHDIIRTWAFYTILRCHLITDEKPFENIMMGGFILSEDGTPMHASLGNVIDPLKIINEYGTDAFRCYAASCSLGEDNAFRVKDVIRGTRLLRKLWNVQQFIHSIHSYKTPPSQPKDLIDIDKWILTKYSQLVHRCTSAFDVFDYAQAMKEAEYFLWHEFADHYIELAKSAVYTNNHMDSITYTVYTIGLGILKLFAPFFPHLTEEIYTTYYQITDQQKSIHISSWPTPVLEDIEAEQTGEYIKNFVAIMRAKKSEKGIALNAPFPIIATYAPEHIIARLQANASIIQTTLNLPETHHYIIGKPDIEEHIIDIKPNHAKIGPAFKQHGKTISTALKTQKDHFLKILQTTGDITIGDILTDHPQAQESLIKQEYVALVKEHMVKGTKDHGIIHFDKFYIELPQELV